MAFKHIAGPIAFAALYKLAQAIEFNDAEFVFEVTATGKQIYRCEDGSPVFHRAEADMIYQDEVVGRLRFTESDNDDELLPTFDFFATSNIEEDKLDLIAEKITDFVGETFTAERGSQNAPSGSVQAEVIETEEVDGSANCINPDFDDDDNSRLSIDIGEFPGSDSVQDNLRDVEERIDNIRDGFDGDDDEEDEDEDEDEDDDDEEDEDSTTATDTNGDECDFTGDSDEPETLGNIDDALLDALEASGFMEAIKEIIRESAEGGQAPTLDSNGDDICADGDSDDDIESDFTATYKFGF